MKGGDRVITAIDGYVMRNRDYEDIDDAEKEQLLSALREFKQAVGGESCISREVSLAFYEFAQVPNAWHTYYTQSDLEERYRFWLKCDSIIRSIVWKYPDPIGLIGACRP
jgi:hypothetical protein